MPFKRSNKNLEAIFSEIFLSSFFLIFRLWTADLVIVSLEFGLSISKASRVTISEIIRLDQGRFNFKASFLC